MEKNIFYADVLTIKYKTVSYGDKDIKVKKYINSKDMTIIVNSYFDFLMQQDSEVEDVLSAEYGMIIGVLDICTSIELEDCDKHLDMIIDSGLWEDIKSNISNFNELEKNISLVNEKIKKNGSFQNQILSIVDKLPELFSDDKIKGTLAELNKAKEEVSKFYPTIQTEKKKGRPKKSEK